MAERYGGEHGREARNLVDAGERVRVPSGRKCYICGTGEIGHFSIRKSSGEFSISGAYVTCRSCAAKPEQDCFIIPLRVSSLGHFQPGTREYARHHEVFRQIFGIEKQRTAVLREEAIIALVRDFMPPTERKEVVARPQLALAL